MGTVRHIDAKLYEAAAKGHIDMFKNYSEPLDSIVTPNENTILHIYLNSRGKIRFYNFIEEVLAICPSLLLQVNNNDDTPLHIAARYGYYDEAEVLINHVRISSTYKDLEKGKEAMLQKLIRMVNKNKDTALHEAARNSQSLDIVKILAKENPDFSYSANARGETPLYLAIDRGCREIAIEMLNSYNPHSLAYTGPNCKTTLHVAIMHEELGLIDMLLEKMINLAKETDGNGWSPLHYAAAYKFDCFSHVIQKLLDEYSLGAYATNEERKRTALHFAACIGNMNAVKAIISKSPNCYELTDNKGWNVLHYVIITRDYSHNLFQVIVHHKSLLYLLNAEDIEGNTPLDLLLATHPPFWNLLKDEYLADVFMWSPHSDLIPQNKASHLITNQISILSQI